MKFQCMCITCEDLPTRPRRRSTRWVHTNIIQRGLEHLPLFLHWLVALRLQESSRLDMLPSDLSEILAFLRIAQKFCHHLDPFASNIWMYVQPRAALSKEGYFDTSAVTLPRLIYGNQYPDEILIHHIDLFWADRGRNEEMVAYAARRLQARPECFHLHRSNGHNYLCVNFSPSAKKDEISRMSRRSVVPPWLQHAVDIFSVHRGLQHEEALIVAAIDKAVALPCFEFIRAPTMTSRGGSGGSGGSSGSGGSGGSTALPPLHVDCTLPAADGAVLISPASSVSHETTAMNRRTVEVLPALVSPDNESSSPHFFQKTQDNNDRLCKEYLSSDQYELKEVPPSKLEKKVAAHIVKRCTAERKEKGYVSLPSLKGQEKGSIAYTKLPTKSDGNEDTQKAKIREVGRLIDVIIEYCGADSAKVVKAQTKKLDDAKVVLVLDKLSLEDRRSLGLLMMRVGRFTSACYHENRMLLIWRFGKDIVHVLGAPLEHLRLFRRDLVKTEDILHGVSMMETTGGVIKKCHWWIRIRPHDALASDYARVCNGGRYQPCREFSDGTDEMLFLATNSDGDTDTISEMARLCDQVSGNTGDRVMLMGQIKDGANESSNNLSKFLLEPPAGLAKRLGLPEDDVTKNPLHTFRQSTFNDGVVVGDVEMQLPEGDRKVLAAAFYYKCNDPQHVPIRDRQPDNFPSSLEELVVSDEMYLQSSSHPMKIDSLDQLRLLKYSNGSSDFLHIPVAIGAVGEDGDISSWSCFMDGDDNALLENEGCIVRGVSFRRVIGFSADDTKILCIYCGHLGCAAKFHCPKCTHRHYRSMANIATKGEPRRGEYSHSNSYRKYLELGDAHDEDDRREQSFSIGHVIIYTLDPNKMFSGLFHKINGSVEKLDVMLKQFLEGQDRYLLAVARAMLKEIDATTEEAKKRRRSLLLAINDLSKEVDATPKQIAYHELSIEEEKKGSNRAKTIKAHQDKITVLQTKLPLVQAELKSLRDELGFIKKIYIPAFDHALLAVKAYLPGKNKICHLVLMQDEAYRRGCGVRLRGYFGGRSMIGRDAYALIQGWSLVMECYEEMLRERIPTTGTYNIDAITDKLQGAAEVARPLSTMAEILSYQSKTAHLEVLFGESAKEFSKALTEHFADQFPYYKGHGTCVHDPEIMDYYGFAGRGDEQGFENSHYVNGSLSERFRSVHNTEQRSEILLQTRESLRDPGAEKMLQEFMESRTKSTREIEYSQRIADSERRQELWNKWAGRPRSDLPADPSILPDGREVGMLNQGEDENTPSQCSDDELGEDVSSQSEENSEGNDSDDDDDNDDESSDDDSTRQANAEEDILHCRACTELSPPPSSQLVFKPIVVCNVCAEAMPKAARMFHVMKFHAKAPYLDDADAQFKDLLPLDWAFTADDTDESDNEVEDEDESSEVASNNSSTFDSYGDDDCTEEVSEGPDYNQYKVAELRQMLLDRNFTKESMKGLKKAELVDTLKADDCGEFDDE